MSGEGLRSEESLRHEREAVAMADRVAGGARATKALRLAGRVAGRGVGALLLLTGLAKAYAPAAFGQQVAAYKIVEHPALVGVIAYAVIVAECGLGASLLANFKPKASLALAGLLLLIFTGAVGYAWQSGSLADCGCMPWMTRTPKEAFFEDLALLGLVGWALWGQRGRRAPDTPLKLAVVTVALAAALVVPGVMGLAGPRPGVAGEAGSEAFRTMKLEEAPADLSRGEHLVLLMSTECAHCQESVPKVNELAADARLPKLVAVASEDRVARGLFREDYKAAFPIAQISAADRNSLLKDEFPRLFLVRDGAIVAAWDGVPEADEILAGK
jgi:hypothetical protein